MIPLEQVQRMVSVLLLRFIHLFPILIISFHNPGASGIWGIVAIGLLADNPYPLDTTNGRKGLLKGLA